MEGTRFGFPNLVSGSGFPVFVIFVSGFLTYSIRYFCSTFNLTVVLYKLPCSIMEVLEYEREDGIRPFKQWFDSLSFGHA